MRSVMNIRTGRGQPQSDVDKEYEFVLQFTKTFGLKEMESKLTALKAEGRMPSVEALKPFLEELTGRLNGKILTPAKRYSNHEYDYVQASIESQEFQQALEEGYEIMSSNGNGLHVLRRKKASA